MLGALLSLAAAIAVAVPGMLEQLERFVAPKVLAPALSARGEGGWFRSHCRGSSLYPLASSRQLLGYCLR